MNKLMAITGLAGLACAAFAAQAAEVQLSEQDFIGELPVVLSASRLAQPINETPATVTVLDRALIRSTGARSIPELLRFVPGFTLAYLKSHQPVITYHGLGGESFTRLQVLVDGRSIYNPILGTIDFDEVPVSVDDLERIEVVRGPSTPTHGIGAFLGVVNLITRHSSQDRGLYLAVRRGNDGIQDQQLRFGGQSGDLDYRVSAGYRSDSGFERNPDGERITYVNLRGDLRLNVRDSLQVQAGASAGPRGYGWSLKPEIDYPREISADSAYVQLRWQRTLSADEEFYLQAYHYRRDYLDQYSTLPLPPASGYPAPIVGRQYAVDDSYYARRSEFEFQHTLRWSPAWRGVWGFSGREDRVRATQSLSGLATNRISRFFAHGEWQPSDQLRLNAGFMFEDNNQGGRHTSPRVAVNFHMTPAHTLRANLSRALRSPSVFEEKADRRIVLGPVSAQLFRSAGNLRPEEVLSREVGYFGQWRERKLSVDVRLFRDSFWNLINTDKVVQPGGLVVSGFGAFPYNVFLFRNFDRVEQYGHEIQFDWQPYEGTRVQASQSRVIMSGPAMAPYNDPGRLPDYNRSGSSNQFRLFVSQDFGQGLSASAFNFYQRGVTGLGYAKAQDDQHRLDLHLAKRFRLGSGEAEVALSVQNARNKPLEEFRGEEFLSGRRSFVTLRFEH